MIFAHNEESVSESQEVDAQLQMLKIQTHLLRFWSLKFSVQPWDCLALLLVSFNAVKERSPKRDITQIDMILA